MKATELKFYALSDMVDFNGLISLIVFASSLLGVLLLLHAEPLDHETETSFDTEGVYVDHSWTDSTEEE